MVHTSVVRNGKDIKLNRLKGEFTVVGEGDNENEGLDMNRKKSKFYHSTISQLNMN